MNDWIAAFISVALSQQRKLWTDEAAASAYLKSLIDERLSLNQPEILAKRRDFFELPGTRPEDYREQLISVPGGRLLAGIRFRDLEREFPFLEIHSDLPLDQLLAQRETVTARLQEAFRVFAPLGMTLRLPPHQVYARTEVWNLYLAGPLRLSEARADYQLVQPQQIIDYTRFLAEYQAWGRQHPELAGRVSPESVGDLQDAFDAGLYFELQVQGQTVGLIAGQASPYWDRSGLYIIEELVFLNQQGQGFGRSLQALFQQTLRDRFDCIWGTIHPQNQASLKTAQACGRKITEQEVFFRF